MTTRRASITLVVVLVTALWQGCGSAERPVADHALTVALPAKTLALAVNPKTGALLAETGSGVYVLPAGTGRASRKLQAVLLIEDRRVAVDKALTIAYTGDGGLVGSSHPNQPDERGSRQRGTAHIARRREHLAFPGPVRRCRSAHPAPSGRELVRGRFQDFSAAPFKLLTTDDYGRTWDTHQPPGLITDVAVDPTDPRHAFAATDKGLLVTHDEAAGWRPGGADAKALAWASGGPLYLGGDDGRIRASADGDSAPQTRGDLGTSVAGLTVGPRGRLWALGADQSVRVSSDGGRHWTVRYHLRQRQG